MDKKKIKKTILDNSERVGSDWGYDPLNPEVIKALASVMITVNNDRDKASEFLREMYATGNVLLGFDPFTRVGLKKGEMHTAKAMENAFCHGWQFRKQIKAAVDDQMADYITGMILRSVKGGR